MDIRPDNILIHEIIGLKVEVVDSLNKSLIGLKGKIIDETMKTLIIHTSKGRKVVEKKVAVFVFELPSGLKVKVEGKYLVGRPEDRLKRRLKFW